MPLGGGLLASAQVRARLAPPVRWALRLAGPEIWIGEANPEAGCRRLTLRHRREATVDVGSTPFCDLKADRIVWIIGLRV